MSKTISSREFNQNVSAAKRAAASRPVFITDRGRPSLVLMSIDHYERLTGTDKNIVEQLAMPGPYIEFEPGRLEPLGLDVPDLSQLYLLDTNVVSELRKAGTTHAHDGVIRWASGLDTQLLYLSVITTMELEIGVLRIARRDAAQGEALRRWFDDQVLRAFADRVLPIDQAVVSRCASMHVPDPKSDRDAFIGATALEHGLTVATRSVKDFTGLGVDLLDPWNINP